MLSGVRIYTSDNTWRQILGDLNAIILNVPDAACVNFDELSVADTMSAVELKALVLQAADEGRILTQIFGAPQSMPRIQTQIIALLYKTGGMTMSELKRALGYAPDIATHTVDTAIYNLRRAYGRDFIKNLNGVYSLGKL